MVYYTHNRSALSQHNNVLIGSLDNDPCNNGRYIFTPIPDTNLYLLVLEELQTLSDPWNINCRIRNHAAIPGAHQVTHGTCEGEYAPILYHRPRVCSFLPHTPPTCGYSAAIQCCASQLVIVSLLLLLGVNNVC